MRLRVMTANLAGQRCDAVAFARLVERLDPDVLAVQELSWRGAAELGSLLPHGSLEPADDHKGMGIALRHPGEVGTLALPYRDARFALLGPPHWEGRLEVLSVHLAAPPIWPPWGTWLARRNQLAGLEWHLDRAEGPLVLVGDLNATPLWPIYRRLAPRFRDAATLVGRKPQRTWGPKPGGPKNPPRLRW